jgi:Ser/Thr protein kinase RdoA (MazF antagonist)
MIDNCWSMTAQPPPAEGVHLPWSNLPARLRSAIERWLGAPVISAITQPGGFSPGLVARLQSADGHRVFVKAVGPELNPDSPAMYRREAQVVATLPSSAPVPQLLWTHDEGDGGWIVLAFEDVEGQNPAQPWRTEELDRVLEALVALSATLTPSPIPLASAGEKVATEIRGWQLLQSQRPAQLDSWSTRHLDALADLEMAAVAAVAGNTLLHFDIRADNVLLTSDRVYVVDWPHACIGAAWVDPLFFAPSVAMQGGPDPEALMARHPAAMSAHAADVMAALAAVAGFFTYKSLQPAPPGLPTLRSFQAAQGAVARSWLARRTGWS